MVLKSVAKHLVLAMTALNTFKTVKQDLGLGPNVKAVIIEDIAMELQSPDIVASTLTAVYGAVAIGNQETVLTSTVMSQPGVVIADKNVIVSDATPLPVIYNCQAPVYREGPFQCYQDPDGLWYVTLAVHSVACTAVKSVQVRLDLTVEL
jgi:hypothetical protein